MVTIKIANADAHGVFHTMAEGMWEVRRDVDDMLGAVPFDALIEATPAMDSTVYPASFELPDPLVDTAQAVLDNLDADEDVEPGDIDLAIGEPVAIKEMETREALELALELLEERASETDTADPQGHRVRLAIGCIEELLTARGAVTIP